MSSSSVFIGIDNGSTGSIGIQVYNANGVRTKYRFMETPTFMMQDYQKRAKRISQLDFDVLRRMLRRYRDEGCEIHTAMERPTTGKFFNTMICAARIHQQYIDLFTFMRVPMPQVIDSKQWQEKFLPHGTRKEGLKRASLELALRRWPKYADVMSKHKDADGMWICEWMRKEIMA